MHKIFSLFFILMGTFFISIGINTNYFSDHLFNLESRHTLEYSIKSDFNNLSFLDSSTINKLYSEKYINKKNSNEEKNFKEKNFIVKIKPKPINPNIVLQGDNESVVNIVNVNFDEIYDFDVISENKSTFIKTLLPLISYQNHQILIERKHLTNLRKILNDNKTLSNQDLYYLNQIAKKYKLKIQNKHKIDLINELLSTVDIIPNSIVLAQAANESGWGTSRFAKDYNAFFGEYTYDFSKGVLPLDREEGKTHFVKAFSSSDKSVESYFRNINTHHAYKDFRLIRKLMREKNNFTDLNLLINTLDTYAEDEKYIETISSIIQSNKLFNFDILIFTLLKS